MKQHLHSLWKCLFLPAVALTLSLPSYSQSEASSALEGHISTGPMVFLGDLGGHFGKGTTLIKDWNWPTTKLNFAIGITAYPVPWLGLRFDLTYGHVAGDDALIKNHGGDEKTRLDRNLDFRSVIIEGMGLLEFYPTTFLEEDPEEVAGMLRPYGVIGIGYFHFNPQGTYHSPNGDTYWVDLAPLHTEGQGFPEYPDRKPYKLNQMNIPMGVGIKYFFSENLNISFEIIHRKTFTDYIDDVSTKYIDPALFYKYLPHDQAVIAEYMANKSPLRNTPGSAYHPGNIRGNSSNNDAYFTTNFKIGFRLNGGKEQRWRNSTHCPLLRF